MENKVIIEGVILNQPKLTQFNTTLLRIKNTETYTKKDGSTAESTYTGVVSCEWAKLAQEVCNRFKQGDTVRVEGKLKKKKTDKLDHEGNEIYETWIKALSVNALPNMQSVIEGQIELERKAKHPQALGQTYVPKPLPKPNLPPQAPYGNKTPVTKQRIAPAFAQPLPIPTEDPENQFEEVFDNDLPF